MIKVVLNLVYHFLVLTSVSRCQPQSVIYLAPHRCVLCIIHRLLYSFYVDTTRVYYINMYSWVSMIERASMTSVSSPQIAGVFQKPGSTLCGRFYQFQSRRTQHFLQRISHLAVDFFFVFSVTNLPHIYSYIHIYLRTDPACHAWHEYTFHRMVIGRSWWSLADKCHNASIIILHSWCRTTPVYGHVLNMVML